MANPGKLIVFEGGDKVGKETQSKLLLEYLINRGEKAVRVEVPVKDAITYRAIYWTLRNGLAVKHPNAFQALQYLNKRLFQETKLKSLLVENNYVILDRWLLSSIVYGACSGANTEVTKKLSAGLIKPDMTVILEGDPLVSRKDDAYEADTALQHRVRDAYRVYASFKDSVFVSNSGGRPVVHSKIVGALLYKGVI